MSNAESLILVVEQIIPLIFQRLSAKGSVQILACVLSAPSNQGVRGQWAC